MKQVVESCLVAIEGDAASFRAQFLFPGELEVFAGHFPDRPLVPGVFLIEAVRVAAQKIRGGRLRIARIRDAKFLAIVEPDSPLEVTGSLTGNRCRADLTGGTRVDLEFS